MIPSDLLLSDFHKIIQTSMGWTNAHMHQFMKGRTLYSLKMEDDDFWDEMDSMDSVDYKNMKVTDLLKKEKDKITYEYDFGDGWIHDITLEKILAVDITIKQPLCLAGEMNCPPEDIGGIWGYTELLKILKKPDHEDYENYIEWLGEDFDPGYFSIDVVNELLREKDYGCIEFDD